jgi:hypothetical protein
MGYQGSRKARLEYLMQDADGTLSQVTDLSVLAEMLAIGGDVSDYSSTTDSLEAISNAIAGITPSDPFLATVGGALDDAVHTGDPDDVTTLMGYSKQSAQDGETLSTHSSLFTGENYYVDAGMADDTADGTTPRKAKKTIGAAIGAASAGDRITIKSGTYTETGLDVNLVGLEINAELGAVIDPASGTALTVSANYVRIYGYLGISPAAGETGLLVSGNFCEANNVRTMTGGTGYKVTGSGSVFRYVTAGNQTAFGYDIDGSQTRLYSCSTVGVGASIGYNIGTGSNTGVLSDCTSVNHQTSGYTIETGCANWTIVDCSSGAGDGRWVDVDEVNVWCGFCFNDEVTHDLTFDASGRS